MNNDTQSFKTLKQIKFESTNVFHYDKFKIKCIVYEFWLSIGMMGNNGRMYIICYFVQFILIIWYAQCWMCKTFSLALFQIIEDGSNRSKNVEMEINCWQLLFLLCMGMYEIVCFLSSAICWICITHDDGDFCVKMCDSDILFVMFVLRRGLNLYIENIDDEINW